MTKETKSILYFWQCQFKPFLFQLKIILMVIDWGSFMLALESKLIVLFSQSPSQSSCFSKLLHFKKYITLRYFCCSICFNYTQRHFDPVQLLFCNMHVIFCTFFFFYIFMFIVNCYVTMI